MKIIKWSKYISPETKFYEKMRSKKGLYITGQNGIIFPDSVPDKKFNLFEGHANFAITNSDFELIKRIKGVELAYPISAYRVMVGIAKMFDEKQVLLNIDRAIDPYVGVHDEIINRYKIEAMGKYPDYIIFEDCYGMISITEEKNEPNIDGFMILRANQKPSGV